MPARCNSTHIASAVVAALLAFQVAAAAQDSAAPPAQDPPGRVARISILQGNVSLEPAGVDSFSQAEVNYPLTVGDRIYVDLQGLAELETAGLAVRLANGADLTVASLTDQVAQFGLAQGSIRVATRDLAAPGNTQAIIEIDTPNGSVVVTQLGDLRIDSYPQDDTTVVTVNSGEVQITGSNLNQTLGAGQSLRLAGTNPVSTQLVGLLPADALDTFDQTRESLYQGAVTAESQYVDPSTIGADDLAQYGDWTASADYGEVWSPRGVAVGWQPYHNGHWAWVAPWGWTWVESEPWGFAPFHYGRWTNENGRWVWVPGPPPVVIGRPVRPIYSPALVAFVGGGGPGLAITAWFPLGPREPFVPWYHASTGYLNRVNVTNIYDRNGSEVRANLANRTTSLYATTNITYANRTGGTTAIGQQDFAAGRSVAGSKRISLDPSTRAQLEAAPVLPHPMVTPGPTIAAPQAPARALPPHMARPVLETRAALASPAPSTRPAEITRPETPFAPAPVTRSAPAQPTVATPAPGAMPTVRNHPVLAAPSEPAQALPRPADQPRTLINRTEPQPVQPPFQQQREEIERNDPGRPLGPVQVQNMRAGRPAGAPSQPEPAQHPAPPPPPARTPPKPEPKPK